MNRQRRAIGASGPITERATRCTPSGAHDEAGQSRPPLRAANRALDSAAFASLRAFINSIPTPVLVKDDEHRYFALNHAFTAFFNRSAEDIFGKTDFEFFAPDDAAYYQKTDSEALQGGRVIEYEHRYDVKDGSRHMLVRKSRLVLPDGRRFVVLVLTDITEAWQSREALARSVRTGLQLQESMRRKQEFYAALSATNRAMIRLRDRDALFRKVCDVAVEYCHFRLVWVGLIEQGSSWIRPVALAGPASKGYPPIRVSIDSQVPEGRGYTSQVLRENEPLVVSDYFADSRVAPWADKVRAAGIRSLAAFPLQIDGRCIGSVTFYGGEVGFFTEELVELLGEMVSNLSFALSDLEREQARAAYQKKLEESEERFRQLASAIPQVFWIASPAQDELHYISPAYEEIWGRPSAGLASDPRRRLDFVYSEDQDRVHASVSRTADGQLDHEYRIVRPDGSIRWIHERSFPVRAPSGERLLVTGIAEDVSERKDAQARLLYLAHHDHLTGLPNRVLFCEQFRQQIGVANAARRSLALVFIDLDHFKMVNETLGHPVGDELLCQVARRMTAFLTPRHVVARLGGDEFAFLLEHVSDREAAGQQVRALLEDVGRSFQIGSKEVFVTASAGVAVYPDDGSDVDTLMKNADMAMHHVKHAGRMDAHFFESQMKERASERMTLEGLLRRAVTRNEFVLHYQPRVDVLSGATIGVEALLRWHHPDLGNVPPSRFVPVLEENGLILPVGEWVVEEACRQLKAWIEQGLGGLTASINISARQLQDKGIERKIADIVSSCSLDPSRIELELTESVLMNKPDEVAVLLTRIKQCGMRISVDDFGTGYSSLSYLKRFPLDVLKIDRSFVKDMLDNPEDVMIIRAIVALARSLKLRTVAEGVETEEQFSLLARLGCDEYQGYLVSPPLPGNQLAAMLVQ